LKAQDMNVKPLSVNLGFNMLFKLGNIFIHRHNVKNQSLTSIVQTLN